MGVKNLQKKLNLLEADIASHQVTKFIYLQSFIHVRPMFNSLNIGVKWDIYRQNDFFFAFSKVRKKVWQEQVMKTNKICSKLPRKPLGKQTKFVQS